MKAIQQNDLKKVNNWLSVVVVLLAVYITVVPFLPQLSFWWQKITGQIPQDQTNAIVQQAKSVEDNSPEAPEQNILIIPSLNLSAIINEGNTTAALKNQAVWLRPNSSLPDHVGNTVIVGHRFTYSDPGVFYHLDKVKVGDKIGVYWKRQLYNYEVVQTIIVEPTATAVEAPTQSKVLTLYTCTPLWTSKQRLVIRALPIESEGNQ